jgi:hypothetical protein
MKMKGISLVVSALVVGALAFGESADAQTRFGIAAGAAVPTGDFGDGAKAGFNVEGSVEFKPMTMPFGLRADLFYNRFAIDEDEFGETGNFTALGGALNAIFQMSGVGAAPYLLVGPTVTNIEANIDGTSIGLDIGTKFGAQGGIGVKFPLSGFTSKVEARIGQVFSEDDDIEFPNVQWFTVNFGILFGGVQ